jgi:predicted nucleic acid-binding protein
MTEYVFDTEPLVAYLYDEPGASTVTELLQAVDAGEASGAVSHATATELLWAGIQPRTVQYGDPQDFGPHQYTVVLERSGSCESG